MKNLFLVTSKANSKFLFLEEFGCNLEAIVIEDTKEELSFFQKTINFVKPINRKRSENKDILEKYSIENRLNTVFQKNKVDKNYEEAYAYKLTTIDVNNQAIKEVYASNLSRNEKKENIINIHRTLDAEYLYLKLLSKGKTEAEAQVITREVTLNEKYFKNSEVRRELEDTLGKEDYIKFKNNKKFRKGNLYKKAELELSVAEGKITQKEAQEQFDKHIKEQIKKDPDLKKYYSDLVENAKSHTGKAEVVKNIYNFQENNKTISRENIFKVIDFAEKSGLNLGSIIPQKAEDGSLSFDINPKKTLDGVVTKITIKISKEGDFSVKNDLFDDKEKPFKTKEELEKIVEFSEYNAILYQVVEDNNQKPKELEKKINDERLEKIIISFKKYSFSKNQNPQEIFRNIIEKMINDNKEMIGDQLFALSQKAASSRETILSSKTTEETKDVNLGGGQKNNYLINN